MPTTLLLLVETVVGLAIIVIWWVILMTDLEEISSRPNEWVLIIVPSLVFGTVALKFTGNWWLSLGLASPIWVILGFGGLDKLATSLERRRKGLDDWVWGITILFLLLLLVIYVVWPLSDGDVRGVFGNLLGVVAGILLGGLAGTFLVRGLEIGSTWKTHEALGTVGGGAIGVVLSAILLTVAFDTFAGLTSFPASALRLYVVFFLPSCVVAAMVVAAAPEVPEKATVVHAS